MNKECSRPAAHFQDILGAPCHNLGGAGQSAMLALPGQHSFNLRKLHSERWCLTLQDGRGCARMGGALQGGHSLNHSEGQRTVHSSCQVSPLQGCRDKEGWDHSFGCPLKVSTPSQRQRNHHASSEQGVPPRAMAVCGKPTKCRSWSCLV